MVNNSNSNNENNNNVKEKMGASLGTLCTRTNTYFILEKKTTKNKLKNFFLN